MTELIIMNGVLILTITIINAVMKNAFGVSGYDKVMEGSITVIILYAVLLALFGDVLSIAGLPFVDQMDYYKTISRIFHEDIWLFIRECAELVSLTFVISFVSQAIPSGWSGTALTGKIIRSMIVVLIGVIINNYFYLMLQKTIFFSWAVNALQCFFLGTALLVTPAMILGNALHVTTNNALVTFLVQKLPQTKVGKAVSTSVTNSLVLIGVIMIFENQFGSLGGVLNEMPSIVYLIFGIGVLGFILRFMISMLMK